MSKNTSLKERVQKSFDDAQKKADKLGEEEINARLGPATRKFFEIGEKIEDTLTLYFPGLGTILIGIMIAFISSNILYWLGKSFLLNYTVFMTVSATIIFVTIKSGLETTTKMQGKINFFFWLFFALNGAIKVDVNDYPSIITPVFFAGITGYTVGLLANFIRPKSTKKETMEKEAEDIINATKLETKLLKEDTKETT